MTSYRCSPAPLKRKEGSAALAVRGREVVEAPASAIDVALRRTGRLLHELGASSSTRVAPGPYEQMHASVLGHERRRVNFRLEMRIIKHTFSQSNTVDAFFLLQKECAHRLIAHAEPSHEEKSISFCIRGFPID